MLGWKFLLPEKVRPVLLTAPPVVLVVDDEPGILRYTCAVLQRAGYRALAACDADQAVLHARTVPVDLLLTDAVLPQVCGREVVAQVKSVAPDVSVLYMSGQHPDTLLDHVVGLGTAHLLPKPFQAADLVSKVRGVLDARCLTPAVAS